VTFLFTDVEGSTLLWQTAPEAMPLALERHDVILRSSIESHDGYVFSTGGDGFGVAFARAREAVSAAVEAQTALAAERWPAGAVIRVRMGLHTGEAAERGGDYFGTPVNQTARLMALGHGGQVLCSAVTAGLVGGEIPLVDLGEHRLKDLSTPQRVLQVGEGRFPPLRSVVAVPGNLPRVLTELVGRTEDLAALVSVLGRDRLVTLTGVGGVGKTRLALAAAAATSFADGCWFVELASLSSTDEVVNAVAAVMGGSASDLHELARFVSGRRLLIVLDNCEHVLGAAARVAQAVVGAGPDSVVLATSREPLGVNGEVVRGVASLTVPDGEVSATEASTASAVALFVARARSSSTTFDLDDGNAGAVVEICRRLDGIPLAIELAAARVRAMAPADIAQRISERFELLSAGRGSLERHRTLAGAVSWSHELLSDEEKVVFRRLAVFPASFDLDAAERIAAKDGADGADLMVRLVDQSLVVYNPVTHRYRLLETLRQFAADRLADAGETGLLRERHAAYFFGLATDCLPDGDAPARTEFERLKAELDNLGAVADWFAQRERWRDLLTLTRTVRLLLFGWAPVEGYRWYRDALSHLPDLDDQERVDALGEVAYLGMGLGKSTDDPSGTSIALADAMGLRHSPWAWHCRGATAHSDPVEAKAAAEMMLVVAEDRGDAYCAVIALGQLAGALATIGELDRSADLADAALARARLAVHPEALPVAVFCAAASHLVSRAQPDFAGAMRILESNPVDIAGVSQLSASYLDRSWGLAYLGYGDTKRAVRHLAASLRAIDRNGRQGAFATGALALCVALSEAGQTHLAARLDGYTGTHRAAESIEVAEPWLTAQLAKAKSATDGVEWVTGSQAGAALDRRGFLALVAEAERSVEETPAAT